MPKCKFCPSFSGLLFPKFRLGWQVSVHVIPQKSSSKPSLQTFMVISEKETSFALQPIKLLFDHSSLGRNNSQVIVSMLCQYLMSYS